MYLDLEIGYDDTNYTLDEAVDEIAEGTTWEIAEAAPDGTSATFPVIRFIGTNEQLKALRTRWLEIAGDVEELPEITDDPRTVTYHITELDLELRGQYWIKRLAEEYDLHVTGSKPWRFVIKQLHGHYGMTYPRHVIAIAPELIELGDYALLDEMLVHELIHATNPPGPVHGPQFKRRYAKVYPWSKNGPATAFDRGTPRRVLWAEIQRKLPRHKLT